MSETLYLHLLRPDDLSAWEPLDGHAIVTCRVRVQSGAYDAWEPRTYAFTRRNDGRWSIDIEAMTSFTLPSWEDAVKWLWHMAPINIELVTTI